MTVSLEERCTDMQHNIRSSTNFYLHSKHIRGYEICTESGSTSPMQPKDKSKDYMICNLRQKINKTSSFSEVVFRSSQTFGGEDFQHCFELNKPQKVFFPQMVFDSMAWQHWN